MNSAKLLQGNEACVLGALAAGMRFYAGYPITPSTEIAEACAKELPRVGGKFIQMEDEIGSMAAVIGASLAGLKAMTATSGPGFSLKQENLGFAAVAEVPCVVVNVMRGGPSTGLPTSPSQGDVMQARWGTHGDHPIIALSPASVKETYDLTIRAFNLSEKYRTPVILLMDEVIGHMRERVALPSADEIEIINRTKPQQAEKGKYLPYDADPEGGVPPMAVYGEGFHFHVTGLLHDRSGFPTSDPKVSSALLNRLAKKIELNRADIVQYVTDSLEDAELAIIAYGATARSAMRAMRQAREQGIRVGLFRPLTIWPFPVEAVRQLASRVKAILVPEMNLGQLVLEVERVVAGQTRVIGLSDVSGELFKPEDILTRIQEVSQDARNA
ncbi:MAG: 2-oxoacid:acceptor oxidoreductase subunit alpha [Firmicutes bacterium]|nr:2-oxoacid:acceptor oxidoreductase subunit alpha [Bacillota bacterium]